MGIEKTRPAAIDAGQTLGAIQMGNPPAKYTPAVHSSICESIKKGNRPVVAAQMAGIPSHMFYRWMNLGKNGDVHLYQFAEDVEQAIAIFEGRLVEAVVDDVKNDTKNAHWMLERRYAADYAKDVDSKVTSIIAAFMKALEDQLPPHEFSKVMLISSGYSGKEAERMLSGTNDQSDEPQEDPKRIGPVDPGEGGPANSEEDS